jgi:hypothetical protein
MISRKRQLLWFFLCQPLAEKNSQEETVVEVPPEDALEKIIKAPALKRRKKAMHSASISLEAHQDASSSSDVSTPCALLLMV